MLKPKLMKKQKTKTKYSISGLGLMLMMVFFTLSSLDSQAQEKVSGVVKDGAGLTLPGVNVAQKGSKKGVITDIDGNFTIVLSPGVKTLVFSSIGYENIEIGIGNKKTINVTMKESTTTLDDVVIIGYQKVQREKVLGSVSNVKAESIEKAAPVDLLQGIQGKIAGVQVTSNNGPGEGFDIKIRGIGSLNGSSGPLYVVDGQQTFNIDNLNPNDIESFEVLKDGATTAAYGAQGANGVVIITSKSGKRGELNVGVSVASGMSQLVGAVPVSNAKQRISMERTLDPDRRNINRLDSLSLGFRNSPDNQDLISRPALRQQLNVTLSGGSEKSTYLVALGYYDEKGIINKASADRLNLRVNSSHKITNWLKVGHNMGLSTRTSTGFNTTSAQNGLIFSAIRFHPGLPVQYPNGEWGSSQISGQFGDINNPLYEVDIADNDNRYTRLLTNLTPEVSITKDLKLKANFAIDVSINNSRSFNPQILDQIRQRSQNSASRSYNEDYSFLMEYFLDYNKSFGDHKVGFVGGYTQQTFDFQGYNAVANNLPDEDPSQRFLSNGTAAITTEYRNNDGLRSVFGRANYAFKNKYLLTTTVRSDESSKFAEGNRKGVFPAFSLGWRVSDEDFFNVSFINALKLTGGWGELGNQNIDRNQFLARIARNSVYSFGSNGSNAVVGANQISFSNPNVTWETVRMTNVGADASFLDYRLTSTLNYFIKDTDDMLLSPPAIGTQGRNPSPFLNVGEVRNKGFEIELNWQDQKGELSYSISANAAFISNEVISLVEGSFLASRLYGRPAQELSRTYVGSPIATFYGWKADGLFQTQAEVDSHAIQSGAVPGDVRFVDINNDNVIDDKDRGIIGSPHPKMTYGINSNFSYKGFDLTMFFLGVAGVDILNADRMQGLDASYPFNLYSEITGRWTGQGTSNMIPRVSTLRTNLNHRTSDMFIESGDFLRLKNLTIGYTLPTAVVENMSLSLLRLYLSGQNVFTITDYSGLDPELGLTQGNLQQNVDFAQFPQPRTFLLGVNIGF